jgi:hypothetical protein
VPSQQGAALSVPAPQACPQRQQQRVLPAAASATLGRRSAAAAGRRACAHGAQAVAAILRQLIIVHYQAVVGVRQVGGHSHLQQNKACPRSALYAGGQAEQAGEQRGGARKSQACPPQRFHAAAAPAGTLGKLLLSGGRKGGRRRRRGAPCGAPVQPPRALGRGGSRHERQTRRAPPQRATVAVRLRGSSKHRGQSGGCELCRPSRPGRICQSYRALRERQRHAGASDGWQPACCCQVRRPCLPHQPLHRAADSHTRPSRCKAPENPASLSLEAGRRARAPQGRSRRRTSTGTPALSLMGRNSPNAVSWMAAGAKRHAHWRSAAPNSHGGPPARVGPARVGNVLADIACIYSPFSGAELNCLRAPVTCSSRRPARCNIETLPASSELGGESRQGVECQKSKSEYAEESRDPTGGLTSTPFYRSRLAPAPLHVVVVLVPGRFVQLLSVHLACNHCILQCITESTDPIPGGH